MVGDMELVSAVIPAHNAERFVRDAVNSALAQSYPNTEVVVVDDGSTDRTAEILASYGDSIRLVTQRNQGTAAACNAGVAAARGRWIAFLDADDLWMPDKIEVQLARCSAHSFSHTDSWCFGEHLARDVRRSSFEPPYSGRVLEHLLIANFITKSSVLMMRDVFLSYGGFGTRFGAVEDWPFWLRVAAQHDLGYVDQPLVRYRVHPQSKSMAARRTLRDHLGILDEAFGTGGVGAALPHLRRPALASSFRINSHYAAETGDWRFAARCALQALLKEPGERIAWKGFVKALLIPFGHKY